MPWRAQVLGQSGAKMLYSGVFNWFCYLPRALELRAWGHSWRAALQDAQEEKHNCSPSGVGWAWDGVALREAGTMGIRDAGAMDAAAPGRHRLHRRDASVGSGCFGPFPFAKGPLYFVSRDAIQWLVDSPSFGKDARLVEDVYDEARERARRADHASGRDDEAEELWERVALLEDAHMGFWLSHHPSLRLVTLQQYGAWCDHFGEVSQLSRLLMAHRVPWEHYSWLSRLGRDVGDERSRVRHRWQCASGGVLGTAHTVASWLPARSQQACALEVQLRPRVEGRCYRCVCNGSSVPSHAVESMRRTRCHFARQEAPRTPEHCSVRNATTRRRHL